MVADAFHEPGTLLGSEDRTVDKINKILSSWSLQLGGEAFLNPQTSCADLIPRCTKKTFDNCKHSISVCYCCDMPEIGMRN